jgi:hypothetical protein
MLDWPGYLVWRYEIDEKVKKLPRFDPVREAGRLVSAGL